MPTDAFLVPGLRILYIRVPTLARRNIEIHYYLHIYAARFHFKDTADHIKRCVKIITLYR